MHRIRIAIIFGGRSGEHEISIISALSVYRALNKKKYDATLIGIDKKGRWQLPPLNRVLLYEKNPRALKLSKEKKLLNPNPLTHHMPFDVVIPILHGPFGEDGTVQGMLELANIPYVGSGVLGSAIGMDKEITKRLLAEAGIPIVPFITLYRHEFRAHPQKILSKAAAAFGFPFFVKPANLGSSVGIHKVKRPADLQHAIRDAFRFDSKILIEKAIACRELECAVLGNENPQASVVGEIVPNHEFYNYEAKYLDKNGAQLLIPAPIQQRVAQKVQELAVKTFKALQLSGMARIDFFMDRKSGKLYANEANTIPGFTSISMYPKLWKASGIPYVKLIDKLIALALEKHKEKSKNEVTYK